MISLLGAGQGEMDEDKFKANFIATFLATWVANNYDDACFNGEHERLNHPPVEDAEMLATKAYEEWQNLCA